MLNTPFPNQPFVQNNPRPNFQQGTSFSDEGFLNNFATADKNGLIGMGMNVAKPMIESGIARYLPGAVALWDSLKYYFSVNNLYVMKKMKMLLFPFFKKKWTRLTVEDSQTTNEQNYYASKFVCPWDDENAPDLYIPLMSFVTFVLITGLAKGRANRFSPEVLIDIMSSCILTHTFEVLLLRLGLYLMQSSSNFFDIISFTGYKYVGLCINMLVGLLFGIIAYYIALLWTGASAAFFILKTLAANSSMRPSATAPRRELVLAGFALLNFLTIWWLGFTRDLN